MVMDHATATTRPGYSTRLYGHYHLLVSTERFGDEVHGFTEAEMIETFSDDQRAALAAGEVVTTPGLSGRVFRWVDMVAAARRSL